MMVQKRAVELVQRLENEYPDLKRSSLFWNRPLDLLVATILSAQSTDKQINEITGYLFDKYQSVEDYATVDRKELEEDIKSSGFYVKKADYIQSSAKTIIEKFEGEVPDNMEDLLELKGVARKTANIVLQNAFNKTVGIAVDTHVKRLSRRLGLSEAENTDKIEQDLMKIVPKSKWRAFNYLLIAHGRRVCSARKPSCIECVLKVICPSAFTFEHNRDLKKETIA